MPGLGDNHLHILHGEKKAWSHLNDLCNASALCHFLELKKKKPRSIFMSLTAISYKNVWGLQGSPN